MFGNNLTYDDELLNAHYIAGDGRVNENIGLTAVHASSTPSTTDSSTKPRALCLHRIDRADLTFNLPIPLADTLLVPARRPNDLNAEAFGIAWASMERRAAVPGGEIRHRDAVPAPGVRGVRAHLGALLSTISLPPTASIRLLIRRSSPSSRTPSSVSATRCCPRRSTDSIPTSTSSPIRMAPPGSAARPDRGLPESARVRGQRSHCGRSDGRHRARLDPRGRQ